MSIAKADLDAFLSELGFTSETPSAFGTSYSKLLPTNLAVTGYASVSGNPFAGTADPDTFEKVNLSLDHSGTTYRFLSLAALRSKVPAVLAKLEEISHTPNLLRCPKCKVRKVSLKEPATGQRWKPFLSCAGMMISGKGANKQVSCDGTSSRLPPLVVYK